MIGLGGEMLGQRPQQSWLTALRTGQIEDAGWGSDLRAHMIV